MLGVGGRLNARLLPALPDGVKRLMSGGRAVVIDGNTLDPTVQALLTLTRLGGVPGMVLDDDVVASRRNMYDTCMAFGGQSVPVRVDELSIPGPANPIGARHYRPAGTDPAPALVYFHGGGYALGDLDCYDALCRLICRDAGIHVISVDYRLAPEHKAPAAVDDCYAAYRWVTQRAGELGVQPGRIAVGGDSAGGGLAAVVCQLARDDGGPLPVLQLLLYPLTDMRTPSRSRTLFADGFVLRQHDIDWFAGQYLDGSGIVDTDPRVSPLRAKSLAGLPPALVFTGGFDPLRDEGNRYAAAMADAGVPVDLRQLGSLMHGFANFNALGGACSRGIAEMVSALTAHLRRG